VASSREHGFNNYTKNDLTVGLDFPTISFDFSPYGLTRRCLLPLAIAQGGRKQQGCCPIFSFQKNDPRVGLNVSVAIFDFSCFGLARLRRMVSHRRQRGQLRNLVDYLSYHYPLPKPPLFPPPTSRPTRQPSPRLSPKISPVQRPSPCRLRPKLTPRMALCGLLRPPLLTSGTTVSKQLLIVFRLA
jgi:hypothetical protein